MKHPVDVSAVAAYVAGGGLAGVFALLGVLSPKHQAEFNGGAIALVAIAGLIRVVFNPTPPQGSSAVVSSNPPSTAPQDLTTGK